MPSRRSEVLVTEFLRDALAVGALGVPELEARARATGLLGEGQSITHTKAFKRAKKFLRIRSLRAGFGARSGGGNYRDRAKAPSKLSQEPRGNTASQFQSIGSRGLPVSTLTIRRMTSLGTVGDSSWTTAINS
jgi:hypothetical protein